MVQARSDEPGMTSFSRFTVAPVASRISLIFAPALPMIAPATVFVSHAWRYHFVDVYNTLEEHAKQSEAPEDVYFWFDLVCNNQHKAPNLPQLWWKTTFTSAIKMIGRTCLLLAPWSDPIPLTRAWCLFEIFCT